MLINLTIKNFLSIKDPVSFSLLATSDDSHETTLISHPALKEEKLIPCAAIYGANASGKTNFLLAFDMLSNFVLYSHRIQANDLIGVIPFRLDSVSNKAPTEFIVEFIANDIRYKYQLAMTDEEVFTENLYSYENNREAIIFERNKAEFFFTRDKSRQDEIAKNTLKNTSYLAKATQSNYAPVKAPFDWFSHADVYKNRLGQIYIPSATALNESIERKNQFLNFLSIIDLSVKDFVIEKKVKTKKDDETIARKDVSYSIQTLHKFKDSDTGDEKEVYFNLRDESDGTRTLFNIAVPVFEALDLGGTLFVDELEANLHPLAQEKLISLFMDPEQNRRGAQIVFSTHNTNLLNLGILRRDQIWFTEKKENQSTDIYSLADLTPIPRKEANIQKGYLAGKYGAIPFISSKGIFNE